MTHYRAADIRAWSRYGTPLPGKPESGRGKDNPLHQAYERAAARIEANGNDKALRDLARHQTAIDKGCPCRWERHWRAIISIAESL